MELELLNEKKETIDIIDTFESLIWSDRYTSYGDFEIYTTTEKLSLFLTDEMLYLINPKSEHVMIVNQYKIESDAESGNHLTVTGYSLESILMDRCVWTQTTLNGKIQSQVKKLIDQNVINPSDPARKIEDFIFEWNDDPILDSITIRAQFTGDTVYDAIKSVCDSAKVGFKITFNENRQFVFKLYVGIDRSYDQNVNPYVEFSPEFDNIINSNYIESKASYKNVALVAGEGEGINRKTTVVGNASATGLKRKEVYVDARDISSNDGMNTISDAQYIDLLKQRGEKNLAEYGVTKVTEGQADISQMYKYGTDFSLGDIVQLSNEYGMKLKVRVSEFIYSENVNEVTTYPTFENV